MKDYNKRKEEQLGMSYGKAAQRLRKILLYDLAKKLNFHKCYRCNNYIENIEDFSIDHKVPYLYSDNPSKLFFDLNNIAFSHIKCNCKEARKSKERVSNLKPIIEGWVNPKVKTHGASGLRQKCRCLICKTYERQSYLRAYAKTKKKRIDKLKMLN